MSGVATPEPPPLPPSPEQRRRSLTVQQTLYMHPAVYDQLRELAFSRRVKMHSLIMDGLDRMFLDAGLKSIAELTDMLTR
jgi:hypothetical protein